MKFLGRFIPALCCGFMVTAVAFIVVAEIAGMPEATKPIATAEKKIDIPNNTDKWFLSLFLPDKWEQNQGSVNLVKQFSESYERHDWRLVDLKNKTVFQVYNESDPHYQNLFKNACPVLPCVVIQSPDGKVRYKASGTNIPSKPGELSKSIEMLSKNGWKAPPVTETTQRRFRRRDRCGPDGCPDEQNTRPLIDKKRLLPNLDLIPDTILPEPLKKLKEIKQTAKTAGQAGVIIFFSIVAFLLYKLFD